VDESSHASSRGIECRITTDGHSFAQRASVVDVPRDGSTDQPATIPQIFERGDAGAVSDDDQGAICQSGQHAGVGDVQHRWRVDYDEIEIDAERLEAALHGGRVKELRRDNGNPAPTQDVEDTAVPMGDGDGGRSDACFVQDHIRESPAVHRLGGEKVKESLVAEVSIDEKDSLALARRRQRDVGCDRRLPIAGIGRDHSD